MLALSLSLTPLLAAASVAEPDTLAARELDEVVVQGDPQHTSATKTTYLPKAQIKQASQDAVDLLRRMAIPQLKLSPSGTNVSTPSGQEVTLFINYVKASTEDIQGLKTTDVRRVEYLDYPSDPRFRGVPHAVNFIVQEYEWGGYTKLSDRQFVTDGMSNQGSVFSKFTYRKMVYDLYLSTDYVNNHNVAGSSYSTYRLPAADVQRNQEWTNTHLRYVSIPITFRASYNTDKAQIINTAGFSFLNRSIMAQDSRLSFSNNTEDYDIHTSAPYINRSAQWNGNYYFILPHSFNIGAYPQFSYSHNSSWSDYSTTIPGQSTIRNNAREDAYFGRLDLNIGKKVRNHHNFRLDLSGLISANNVDYSGSTTYQSDFKMTFLSAGLAYTLTMDRIAINADAGASYERQDTNGDTTNDSYPYLHLSANWSPNKHNQFGLWAQYATSSPGQSERTPNVLQVNELMYKTGNPFLDNARHLTISANYTFLPTDMFNLNAYCYYFGMYDRTVTVYEPYNSGTALLQTFRNDGDFSVVQAGLNGTLRLFDSNLIIQAGPTFNHYNSTGYINASHNALSCSVYAQYYWGNFNFAAYYGTRTHAMSNGTGAYYTNRSNYSLQAGWSNTDWNVNLFVVNFARYNESSDWSLVNTPFYSSRNVGYSGNYNAAVGLTVTYTVGYGKKIERGNELQGIQGAGSAIMN